ncbi:probable exosome complex exonuclease RRP44 isoform X2 [Centruroides vittatus]|uniref:probable exosome complex exonuclease RRP44 isoform X2 n=1 Tax=Centruroides vittatus TaxID=120091 RepID=UPI0035107324
MAGIFQSNEGKICTVLSDNQVDGINNGLRDISVSCGSKQKKPGGISKKKQAATKSPNIIKNKGKEIKRPLSQTSCRSPRYESVFQKPNAAYSSSTRKTVNRLSSSDPSGDAILRKSISGEQLKGFRYSGSSSPSQSSDITKYNIFRGRGRRGSDSCPEKGYILPYGLRVQHAAHKCMWSGSESGSATSPAGSGSQPSGEAVGVIKNSYILPESKKKGTEGQSRIAAQKKQKSTKDFKFDAYMPLCEVQQGLKKGELIEGVLRINPRNYEDAYISAPDGQMDIYIGGILDRNRALNGDVVVVQLKLPKDWKILREDLGDYQKQQSCKIINFNRNKSNNRQNKSPFKDRSKKFSNTLFNPSDKLNNKLDDRENFRKKKKHIRKNTKKNKYSLETENVPKSNSDDYIPYLKEDFSSTSVNNPVYKTQCEEIKSNCRLHNESNIDSKNDEMDQPWMSPTSDNLFLIPDDIQNYECSELEIPYTADRVTDEDIGTINNGSMAVAPEELSGDEFSQSVSGDSTCSFHLDRVQEDSRFMECLQNEVNNNEENFIAQAGIVLNVEDSLERENDFNAFNCNTEAYIQTGASTDPTNCNEIQQDICSFDHSNSSNSLGTVFNNHVPNDETVSEKCRTNSFVNDNTDSEITNNKQEQNIISLVEVKNQESNNCNKQKKKKKRRNKNKTDISEENGSDLRHLSVTELLKHPDGSRFIQKTAKVVYILEKKHTRKAAGFIKLLQDKSSKWALFSPTDHKLPRIFIPMNECPKDFLLRPDDFSKYLFLAEIIEWTDESKFAKGKLIQKLGETGEVEAETQGILLENGIDTNDFSDQIEKELNDYLDWIVPEEELKERKDFRKECVFTIDPSTARDLDDAVSCRFLRDGLYEIGVHIADVTYFVKENTALDTTASDRATSIYLVQKVIPMLPPLLCERLCSLNPGEDRLTFSVVWKMNEDGEILDEWFGRSMICSCMKLSYNHAQEMIENPQKEWDSSNELPPIHGNHKLNDVVRKVLHLNKIAKKLREKRFRDGALRLDQVKLQFSLDKETGLPSGFTIYEHKDSNKLIEEFMLLANMAVAHRIYEFYPDQALLRRHPPPDNKMMNNIVTMCSAMGIQINSSTSGSLQASLNSLFSDDDIYSQARIQVLTTLCSKPMKCALYFNSGNLTDTSLYHHYALNVPLYTHFTSPIRRYPDIIVHRLLAASLGYRPPPAYESRVLQRLVNHCNDMKYTGKRVNEISSELFLFIFVKECGPLEEKAMVMGVMDHSFDVLILRMGVVKRVYCDKLDLKSAVYEKDRGVPKLTLLWNGGNELRQVIEIFSLVDIIISVCPEETFKFNLMMKNPETAGLED